MMVSMFQLFSCYPRVLVEPPARNRKYNAISVKYEYQYFFVTDSIVRNSSNVPAFLYLLLFGFHRESERPQPDSRH